MTPFLAPDDPFEVSQESPKNR